MLSRTAAAAVFVWSGFLWGGSEFGPARAQDNARPKAASRKPAEPPGRGAHAEDEKAIRAAEAAFARDYNKADDKSLAARFTEDAEVVEENGDRYRGRDLVEKSFAATFAGSPGARLALEIEAIRFLSPDVAQEEGRSTITPAKGAPVSRRYTALFVKQDGRWLISSVREEPDPLVPPHERLKELEWMVGDWVDEGSEAVVKTACRWSDDGSFLLRNLTMHVRGRAVMSVSQRLGWDPQSRTFRSWTFDAKGGFGEGSWLRDGNRWIVKYSGVLPDGRTASATHTVVPETPNRVRWTLLDREVGGEVVSEAESYVLVRVPPPPGGTADGKTAAPGTGEKGGRR